MKQEGGCYCFRLLWVVNMQQLILFSSHLADTVDYDECGSQDVTAGWIFAHNVLIPQLDWHEGAKQLTELLDQQVVLSLVRKKTETKQQEIKYVRNPSSISN